MRPQPRLALSVGLAACDCFRTRGRPGLDERTGDRALLQIGAARGFADDRVPAPGRKGVQSADRRRRIPFAVYAELTARNRSAVSARVSIPMGSARSSIVKLGWWCGKALLLPAPTKKKQPGAARR